MFVENHMTANPQCTSPRATPADAAGKMRELCVHQLPVVDDARRLIGIITDRDVRSASGYDPQARADLRVEDIMTPDPQCIAANAPLEDAVVVLSAGRFNALPVLRDTVLVGIISREDVLRAFCELLGLDRSGRRIEVALPNGVADIASAVNALDETDRISSLIVARLRADGDEPVLYMRSRANRHCEVERKLRAQGLILLMPEYQADT
jgi:acetoin utilization protein AcuB